MASLAELPAKTHDISNRPHNQLCEIEGNRINVSWKEFLPPQEHPKDEAIILLPGRWVTENTEELAKTFAQHSKRKAFLVTTRPAKVVPNSLHQEARAIKQMIVDLKLRRLTIAGHSEGGTKGANLVHVLQEENPEIQIGGLILLNPVGIYEQKKSELAGKYIWGLVESFFRDPTVLRANNNVMSNIWQEVVLTGAGFPRRLSRRIQELAEANPYYREVRCPVILMQGEQDLISSPAKVIPANVLPNSPHVDMFVLKNGDHHEIINMPEKVVNVSLGLLDRH